MKSPWLIVLTVVILICGCLSVCACLAAGWSLFSIAGLPEFPLLQTTPPSASVPTRTPLAILPTRTVAPTASQAAEIASPPVQAASLLSDTLSILSDTVIPENDPLDLARRLEGKTNLPRSLEFAPVVYRLGDQTTFWVSDQDENESFQVQATLRYVTEHVYFWIGNGVTYSPSALKALVETFESKIYPTNREFFGSEWTPGVDGDPHLYILYTGGLGRHIGGYFSTADEFLPVVRADSNGHEMFFINADGEDLGREYTYGTLAHEFQHMIHWYGDRNEDTWVNEGFADLAMLLNGYDIGGADFVYARDPDMQLTDWPIEDSQRSAHYGASFLFMTYFLDRFGEEVTKAVVADPQNGMTSIDNVLAAQGIVDRLTGEPVGADDVFADWVIATYVQDPGVGDGRYTYHNYPDAPSTYETEEVASCPLTSSTRDVSQYGVDYILITCPGDYTLHFEGLPVVSVLPAEPHSGSNYFYSNKADESDITLTRSFDFTGRSGPLTLSYWTWYDLEEGFDYLYLTASLDGENWQILTTPSGVADDPSGNSFGWGYTGASGGGPEWIQERVDLSQFAGKQVQLRFEYITDSGVFGEGFLLDDVSIPEIDYAADFESDDGGWQAVGFARIQNVLPQAFRLALVLKGDYTTVQLLDLPAGNVLDLPIHIGGDVREVILVVSGVTRFTRQKAVYQYSIAR